MEFRRLRGDAAAGYTPVDSAAAVEAFGPALLAVDETLILLHPPPTFSRCFNSDGESTPAE